MKCYVCSYEGEFGYLNATGADWAAFIGRMPARGHLGSVTLHVCPDCGAIHSDMNKHITCEDRK